MRISRPTRHSRQLRRDTRIRGSEDDFEVEDAVDYEMDGTGEDDEDDGDSRDFDTEYDMPMGDYVVQESETFMSTEGVEEERVVDYKIDEDEFHKLSLYDCDFFIRKVPDQDNDVFDFREVFTRRILRLSRAAMFWREPLCCSVSHVQSRRLSIWHSKCFTFLKHVW